MKFRKGLAAFLAAAITVTNLFSAAVFAEDDYAIRGEVVEMLLTAADDYNPDVQKTDIIKGYGDGELHEEDSVTRAQALIMLNRAFGGFPAPKGDNLRTVIPKEEFTDIPAWAEAELEPALDAGIVAGTAPGVFSPDDPVTKEQMELFISRTYRLYGSNLKDSFYETVNKGYLDTSVISEGKVIAGTIYDLDVQTTQQVAEIVRTVAESTPEKGSAQEKIKILYDNIMDMEARNAAGYAPIQADLEAIGQIETVADLAKTQILGRSALSCFASFSLTIDMMDSNSYITVFSVASPAHAKQVYVGQDDNTKQAYLTFITTLLMLCGEDEVQAKADAQAYFDMESEISAAMLPIAEQNDLEKVYNLYTLEELNEIFKTVDLDTLFAESGLTGKDKILVMDAGHMEKVASLLTDDNIDTLKNYLKCSLIFSSAGYFGEAFRKAGLTYNQEMLGIAGEMPLEEAAVITVSNVLADYVGQAYAEKYCTDEIVSDVTDIIHEVIAEYRERIMALDWMSDATKEKALLKLDTMKVNVGAPEKFETVLDAAELKRAADGGSYFQNMMEIEKAVELELRELDGKPVDKTMWITSPQTVNAFYFASFNSINFPIAFLQAPIYDVHASREEKLGGIGFVVAHEITHAFDSSGAQFDENGNAVNWWTEEDAAAFSNLCQEVAGFYEGQEAAPGIVVDPLQTLGENIADLGAVACVTAIGKKQEGFDFQKMFESYALLWRATTTRENARYRANTDVHSPALVRVNRVLQSVGQFYEAYGIQPDDGMWVAPEDRVEIW